MGNVNTVNMSTISGTDVEDNMRTDFECHAQAPPGLGAHLPRDASVTPSLQPPLNSELTAIPELHPTLQVIS